MQIFRKTCLYIFLSMIFYISIYAKPISICIIGDSITAGYGVDVSKTFPSLIKQDLDLNLIESDVYCYGCWGATSEQAKNYSRDLIFKGKKFDIVILAIGINDIMSHFPYKTMLLNLNFIVDLALKNSDFLFMGKIVINNFFPNTNIENVSYERAYNLVYENVILNDRIKFFNFLDMNILNAECTSDGLHPNEKGHKKIFDQINVHLKEYINAF